MSKDESFWLEIWGQPPTEKILVEIVKEKLRARLLNATASSIERTPLGCKFGMQTT
jgi:hypothetical protein